MELPGLATGIDTAAIVQQLMNVSKQRLYSYKVQKQNYADKNKVLDELKGKLNAFNSALGALSDAEALRTFKATSSDTDILSATAASTGVFEGNHKIEVNQLANSERWVHSGFLFKESLVGSGKFIYSYNHQEVIINTDSTTSLEDLAGLINNDVNNPGVTATILEYDDGNDGVFHLVLTGNDAGSDYQITVNSSTTQVLAANSKLVDNQSKDATLNTKIVDLDGFSGILGGSDKITITGTGGSTTELQITDDITVGHLIDHINDAFEGVARAKFEEGRITLVDNVSGTSSTSLSLTYSGTASLSLPTFSTDIADGGTIGGEESNILNPADFTETQAAQDSQIKVDDYPPSISEIQTLTGTATAGTFKLKYNGQETGDIAYNATADDIKAALELLSNVETDDINVSGTLDAGNLTFTYKDTLGNVKNIEIDSSSLTPSDSSSYTVNETQRGQAWITRSSNTLDNSVLPGVSMELYETGKVNISLNKDTQGLKSKLKSLVSAYNALHSFIKEKTAYNEETEEAGELIGNYTTRTVQSILRSGMTTAAAGFVDGEEKFLRAYEIGLDFSDDIENMGVLELDESVLDKAIEEDYAAVAALVGAFNTGRSSGTGKDVIKFNNSSKFTQAGDYDVEVTIGADGFIESARVKLSTEDQWRDQTNWTQNGLITLQTKDDDGNWLPERDLQLNIDLSEAAASTTYTATVHVQQGIAGMLEDRVNEILETKKENGIPIGMLEIDRYNAEKAMKDLDDRIANEEKRLAKKEERLTAQFARLEKTMTIYQQQMQALSAYGF